MKVIKINKYDLIIYGCLVGSILCLGIGAKEYFLSLNENSTIKKELTSAIKEVKGNENAEEEVEVIIESEPDSLKNYDKSMIINSYFSDILDEIIVDDSVSYDMLRTWNDYEVLDFRYIKEIADYYYEYEVDIKINNKDALLPKGVSGIFDNEEYIVITLNIYILESAQNNSFNIRKVEV